MLRKTAEALQRRLLAAFPADRPHAQAILDDPAMPALLGHFLKHVLRGRIDRIDLQVQPDWFDYAAPQMAAAEAQWRAALEEVARIPAVAWQRTLEQGIRLVLLHLIQPVSTLTTFVYGQEDDVLSLDVIASRMGYFLAYPHLTETIKSLSLGEAMDLDRQTFEHVLHRADQAHTEGFGAEDWAAHLAPLFELAQRAELKRMKGAPTALLRIFFEHKNQPQIVQRLQFEEEVRGTTGVDPKGLKRILEVVLRMQVPEEEAPPEAEATPEAEPQETLDAAPPAEAAPVDAPVVAVPRWMQYQQGDQDPDPEPEAAPAEPTADAEDHGEAEAPIPVTEAETWDEEEEAQEAPVAASPEEAEIWEDEEAEETATEAPVMETEPDAEAEVETPLESLAEETWDEEATEDEAADEEEEEVEAPLAEEIWEADEEEYDEGADEEEEGEEVEIPLAEETWEADEEAVEEEVEAPLAEETWEADEVADEEVEEEAADEEEEEEVEAPLAEEIWEADQVGDEEVEEEAADEAAPILAVAPVQDAPEEYPEAEGIAEDPRPRIGRRAPLPSDLLQDEKRPRVAPANPESNADPEPAEAAPARPRGSRIIPLFGNAPPSAEAAVEDLPAPQTAPEPEPVDPPAPADATKLTVEDVPEPDAAWDEPAEPDDDAPEPDLAWDEAEPPEEVPDPDKPIPLWMQYQQKQGPAAPRAVAPLQTRTSVSPELEELERYVIGAAGASRRAWFVRQLFKGSYEAYEGVLRKLAASGTWREASQVIAADVFRKYNINIYSEPAVAFTDAVEMRFHE